MHSEFSVVGASFPNPGILLEPCSTAILIQKLFDCNLKAEAVWIIPTIVQTITGQV